MKNEVDDIIDGLSAEKILELHSKLGNKLADAQATSDITAYLRVEQVLNETGLYDNKLTKLLQTKAIVDKLRTQKYTDGNNNFWSGRGKHPIWVRELLEEGKDIEDYKYDVSQFAPLEID